MSSLLSMGEANRSVFVHRAVGSAWIILSGGHYHLSCGGMPFWCQNCGELSYILFEIKWLHVGHAVAGDSSLV